jgi:hypothetical protein
MLLSDRQKLVLLCTVLLPSIRGHDPYELWLKLANLGSFFVCHTTNHVVVSSGMTAGPTVGDW